MQMRPPGTGKIVPPGGRRVSAGPRASEHAGVVELHAVVVDLSALAVEYRVVLPQLGGDRVFDLRCSSELAEQVAMPVEAHGDVAVDEAAVAEAEAEVAVGRRLL